MILMRVLRVSKGLNQRQLAKLIDLDPAVICHVERNPVIGENRFLTRETVRRLEEFFGVPIKKLLAGVDHEKLLKLVA
ncbi:helix-turn-helix domain-containing protein [Desulfomonile tiedjei]|uniref:Helix-turn-helix protein n=1 Tax=Desulfomonile tiedjei (strain ATCC 49306 / DSM 6799 / DCB-1) TaxID=706587 RepID=I4C603_DESTA|nr:helix-turn-helix transcriptional regulator [Desulfomonile tiedjei]AFM24994.1 Helix-turn-helix protein [Desulfomonile tiedjei DSM 6799]